MTCGKQQGHGGYLRYPLILKEGRRAGRASKTKLGPLLSSRPGSTTEHS